MMPIALNGEDGFSCANRRSIDGDLICKCQSFNASAMSADSSADLFILFIFGYKIILRNYFFPFFHLSRSFRNETRKRKIKRKQIKVAIRTKRVTTAAINANINRQTEGKKIQNGRRREKIKIEIKELNNGKIYI